MAQLFTITEQAKARTLVEVMKNAGNRALSPLLTEEERNTEQQLKTEVAQAARLLNQNLGLAVEVGAAVETGRLPERRQQYAAAQTRY